MTEAIRAAKFLLTQLDGGTETHCTVFRMVPGMSPDTARRRLNDYRLAFNGQKFEGMALFAPGWVCHKLAHRWTFTRPFIAFLKRQIGAAEKLEKQNDKRS
jgi:hypothetical protein